QDNRIHMVGIIAEPPCTIYGCVAVAGSALTSLGALTISPRRLVCRHLRGVRSHAYDVAPIEGAACNPSTVDEFLPLAHARRLQSRRRELVPLLSPEATARGVVRISGLGARRGQDV